MDIRDENKTKIAENFLNENTFKALFLVSVAGVSALASFAHAFASTKKKDLVIIEKSSNHTYESATQLAVRALKWGTFYACTGCGLVCFGIWKLSNSKNMDEFRQKMGSVIPKVSKSNPQGRSDFKSVSELMEYLNDEYSSPKKVRFKKYIYNRVYGMPLKSKPYTFYDRTLYDQQFSILLTDTELFHAKHYQSPTGLTVDDKFPWAPFLPLDKKGNIVKDTDFLRRFYGVHIDVHHFSVGEINISVQGKYINIKGSHENRSDQHGYVSRKFVRKCIIPNEIDPNTLQVTISPDGVLTIRAKYKEKNEQSVPTVTTIANENTMASAIPITTGTINPLQTVSTSMDKINTK